MTLRRLLLLLASLLLVELASPPESVAGVTLRRGMPVEVDLDPAPGGTVVADEVSLLDAPRSTKLRGQLRAFDATNTRIQVLEWSIRIDNGTEWEPGRGWNDLRADMPVEVKLEAVAPGAWRAREIAIDDVKASWKIKGVISEIDGDGDDPRAIEVEGLRVPFVEGTDVLAIEDRIAEDLFRDLKEEDALAPRLGVAGNRFGAIEITGSLRHDFRREHDHELLSDSERSLSEPSLRLELLAQPIRNWKLFSQLRWIGRYPLQERNLAPIDSEGDLTVRQLYLSGRDIAGLPLGLVVGKQRLQDERELLFDEYLDAARLYFYGLKPMVFEATFITPVVALGDKFETWNDWLLQARFYPGERWKARVFALLRNDTSNRQRDSRYYGVGVHGRQGPVKAWLDATQLRGKDKGLDQEAWSLDLGLGLRARDWPLRPSLWAGYAVGTGDADPGDGVSNEYRQTGYEDNSSRVWGIASSLQYGELLDPELTNLRVWSAGAAVRPFRDVSFELIVHRYRLHESTDEFDVSDLRLGEEPLDGVHDDIGHEVDAVLAWRDVVDGLHLVGRLGRFSPGEAFAPTANAAWLQRFELRWNF